MAVDIATLGIAIDSTDVFNASNALKGFTVEGSGAESAVTKLFASINPLTAAYVKLNTTLVEANSLYQEEILTATGLATAQALATAAFEKTAGAIAGTAENLRILKEAQEGMTYNALLNESFGFDIKAKSASESAAVFIAAEKAETLAAKEAAAEKILAQKEVDAAYAASYASQLAEERAALISYKVEQDAAKEAAAEIALAEKLKQAEVKKTAEEVVVSNDVIAASNDKVRLNMMQTVGVAQIFRAAMSGNVSSLAGASAVTAARFNLLSGDTLILAGTFLAAISPLIAMGVAFIEGAHQADQLNQALVSTNNYAGETAGNIDKLTISLSTHLNQGAISTRNALVQLTASGKFTSDTIKLMTEDAIRFSQETGEKLSKVVEDYEKAKGGVVEYAVKHEEAYHDITLAQIDYINKLEKAGDHEAAEKQYFQDIHDNIYNKALPAYGALQTALHDTTTFASNLWDALLGIGRPVTIDQQVNDTTGRVNQLKANLAAVTGRKTNDPDEIQAKTEQANIIRQALGEAQVSLSQLQVVQAGVNTATALQAAQEKAEDDKIRDKYDNQGKGRIPAAHEDNVDKYSDETAKVSQTAAAQLAYATALDGSTFAGLQAKAMQDALTAAFEKSLGPKGEVVDQTLIAARAQANLEAAISKTLITDAQAANSQQDKIDNQQQINALVEAGGITEQEAAAQVANNTRIRLLQNIALHGTVSEMRAAGAEILNLINLANQQKDTDAQTTGIKITDEINKGLAAFNEARDKREETSIGPNQTQTADNEAAKNVAAIIALENNSYGVRLANRARYIAQVENLTKGQANQEQLVAKAAAVYDQQTLQSRLQYTEQFFGDLASLSSSKNREIAAIGKAAAVIQATIDGVLAVQKTIATTPYPWNIPLAAAEAAVAAANVAKIAGLKGGGIIGGNGGPTDDNHIIAVSTGEAVVKASAVDKYRPQIEAMNNDQAPRFAAGGIIGNFSSASPSGTSNVFNMQGSNFGGNDPDAIMKGFHDVMETYYKPTIVAQSVKTTLTVQAQQSKRQKLNQRKALS